MSENRITHEAIESAIISENYFTAADKVENAHESLKLLTFCVLVLQNGFTVTGESACAAPENFDFEIGKKIARDNAKAKIWPLMGYELKSKLASLVP